MFADLGEVGSTASYLVVYGPPITAAAVGLAAAIFPRALVLGRWLGLGGILIGVATVVAFGYWEANECYDRDDACGPIAFGLFEVGWLLSVGVLVAGVVSGIRALRTPE